jgi:lipid-A-disaccharide synthase
MIVAGEASGDVYGARLVLALRERNPDIAFSGLGGHEMQGAGVRLIDHFSALSVVGLTEIIPRMGHISRVLRSLKKTLKIDRPDLLVLIDYPGFNLNLAKKAHALGIPVFYYIPPQIWAWRAGRIKKISQRVDRVAVILPFEKEFYSKHGLEVDYVGHPLLDLPPPSKDEGEIRTELGIGSEREPIIALLPGSRAEEISRLMPAMIGAAEIISRSFPRLCCIVVLAPSIGEDRVKSYFESVPIDIRVGRSDTRELLKIADVALIASGTATLEAAITGTPMVIAYRVSSLTYMAGRFLAKVPYIGLVNLVAGRAIVPELIQGEATGDRLVEECLAILEDGRIRKNMKRDLQVVREQLGHGGAAKRAAQIAADMMGL